MAKNPEDELGGSHTNNQSENIPERVGPSYNAGKKKLKEYILEGLMIFVAVSMGFIAENIRENIADNEREQTYMKSLVEDLTTDKNELKKEINETEVRLLVLDSLINSLSETTLTNNTSNLYYYARLASKSGTFSANTRTIDQIKNSGTFRVIKNTSVTSKMIEYYLLTQSIKHYENIENQEQNEYRSIAVQIFDATIFNQINSTMTVLRPTKNPSLRTADRKLLGDLAGWVHYIKNTRISLVNYKIELLKKGEELIQLIDQQY
jgi:hypothetical protein